MGPLQYKSRGDFLKHVVLCDVVGVVWVENYIGERHDRVNFVLWQSRLGITRLFKNVQQDIWELGCVKTIGYSIKIP